MIADDAPKFHYSGSGDAARKIDDLSVAARVGVVSFRWTEVSVRIGGDFHIQAAAGRICDYLDRFG